MKNTLQNTWRTLPRSASTNYGSLLISDGHIILIALTVIKNNKSYGFDIDTAPNLFKLSVKKLLYDEKYSASKIL